MLVSLYFFRAGIGKRWGLSPKLVLWLYEIIVKTKIFYWGLCVVDSAVKDYNFYDTRQ